MIDLLKKIRITITDANGEILSAEQTGAVSREDFEGGYALYLDATCPAGFAPEDSIVLRADIPDTGDYLSIAAHSEYWCRPQWGESLRDLHRRTQELLIRHDRAENARTEILQSITYQKHSLIKFY